MPMSWTEDDWPLLNRGHPLSLQGSAHSLYTYDWPHKWHDNFNTSGLQLGWYRKNTPVKDSEINLVDRAGYLRIRPGPYKLSSPASPAAIFRKLQHNCGVWKTRLSFSPDEMQSEAGTVAYWNYFTWSSIGIHRTTTGGREIIFTPAEGQSATAKLTSFETEVDLVIAINPLALRFGFQEAQPGASRVSADAGVNWIGESSSTSLTQNPAVGNSFTGLMLGLYAFSEKDRSASFADFAFCEFL